MKIYFLLLAIILVGQLLYSGRIINKKKYCFAVGISLILIAGLANKSMGLSDASGYETAYNNIANTHSISDIIRLHDNAQSQVVLRSAYTYSFIFFVKICSMVYPEYQFFLFVERMLLWGVLSWFIYRYSKIPALSFLLLFALNGFTGSLYLVRTIISTCLGMTAIQSLISGKRKSFLILSILAGTVHISGIIFFLAYPILLLNLKKKHHYLVLIGSVVFAFFGTNIWYFIVNIIGHILPYYTTYARRTGSFSSTWFIVVLLQLIALKNYNECDNNIEYIANKPKRFWNRYVNENKMFYNLSLIYIVCIACQCMIDEFNRIAWFFMFAPAILFSNTIAKEKKEYRVILFIFMFIGLSIYWLMHILPIYKAVPYVFFWE